MVCSALLPGIVSTLLLLVVGAHGQFSMKVHLSSATATEGGHVQVTCDVTNNRNLTFFIIWVKVAHDEEVEIGTNNHINEIFSRTGRYKATYDLNNKGDVRKVTFLLSISNLTSTDSGDIGCRIPNNIELMRKFTVVVPANTVRLSSRDMDNTHAVAYDDDQNVIFAEGEKHKFFCRVNGSYPQPEVKIHIGSHDVTRLFDVAARLVKDGPVRGLQRFYYVVELANQGFEMEYGYSHKAMTCTARDPDSVLPAKTASIVIDLSQYRPKFRCSNQIIVQEFQTDVNVSCLVYAEPEIRDVSFRWKRRAQDVTLKPNGQDGRYSTELRDGKSDFEKLMIFKIDKAFPQIFRTYFFEATNAIGTTVHEIDIIKPGPPQPYRSSAGSTSSTSAREMFFFLLLVVVAVVIVTSI